MITSCGEMCNDNRFELITRYKQKLIDGTNVETAKDEMVVLDNILFRFWQMGWLDKLEKYEEMATPYKNAIPEYEHSLRAEAVKEFAEQVKMAFYYEFDELIPSIIADKIDNIVKEMVGE